MHNRDGGVGEAAGTDWVLPKAVMLTQTARKQRANETMVDCEQNRLVLSENGKGYSNLDLAANGFTSKHQSKMKGGGEKYE